MNCVVVYYSVDELKEIIEKYIKYYNEYRIKEKPGWLSPVVIQAQPLGCIKIARQLKLPR